MQIANKLASRQHSYAPPEHPAASQPGATITPKLIL